MSSLKLTKASESFQILERSCSSLTNYRNLAYNILKYLEDNIIENKEILKLKLCFKYINNILTFSLKAFTILSCEYIFHRSCIEKQLLFIKSSTCSFSDCGKIIKIVMNPNSTRRGS